ncbi:MAG TPA: biopolymer transporter ExbD [Polyangiaceae bacterium]|jgi:biopolymer transport protein ExbD|nr:biopolymer transporter ExbD [Polyangiaceae bacterium]
MGMDVGNKQGAKGDINVTPLIDVVLVLLIIFMVLVPSMLKELTTNIPKKDTSSALPDPTVVPIVVEYTGHRELSVNQEPVAPEALADKISDRLKYKNQKVVFFKIDDEAPYGEVVHFMDIVKGAGATTLGIVTKD